jgi:hypothetical protein
MLVCIEPENNFHGCLLVHQLGCAWQFSCSGWDHKYWNIIVLINIENANIYLNVARQQVQRRDWCELCRDFRHCFRSNQCSIHSTYCPVGKAFSRTFALYVSDSVCVRPLIFRLCVHFC